MFFVAISPARAMADETELPAADLFKQLLTLQSLDVRSIESCRYAGGLNDETVADVFSHYLGIISSEANGRIRTEQREIKENASSLQVKIYLEVPDPESPWQYGFEFELNLDETTQVRQAAPETLRCIGAS